MPESRTWRVAPGSSFRWRHWDDEFVLYHDESGDTHRLNPLGAQILKRLTGSASTAEDLARDFGDGSSPEPALLQTIERLLSHLYGLGLVEPGRA
jgi:PqqD family protein of HPr-rel-A system